MLLVATLRNETRRNSWRALNGKPYINMNGKRNETKTLLWVANEKPQRHVVAVIHGNVLCQLQQIVHSLYGLFYAPSCICFAILRHLKGWTRQAVLHRTCLSHLAHNVASVQLHGHPPGLYMHMLDGDAAQRAEWMVLLLAFELGTWHECDI